MPVAAASAAFATIQGRLPQELRHHRITDYAAANRYREQQFIASDLAH
jgi:hypothetical protein